MPLFINLLLVFLLIGSAALGGYLLARAHFAATIANRVLAYQARLARVQRDARQARTDLDRLIAEREIMAKDLARARTRVHRYETALFEGDLEAAAALAPDGTMSHGHDPALEAQANAYLHRVGAVDDFERSGESDDAETGRHADTAASVSRAIA